MSSSCRANFLPVVTLMHALDLESREVLELDATFIDDEPLASWGSLDQFIINYI